MRTFVAVVVACSLLAGLTYAQNGAAAIKRPVSIPAQKLSAALQSFAQERKLYVIFAHTDVSNYQTKDVSGELTQDEVFHQLLKDTGLTYQYLDENTVSILPASNPATKRKTGGKASAQGNAGKLIAYLTPVVPADASRAAETPNSAAGSKSGDDGIEEMIVTAQKRAERLQDVPISMTALGGDALEGAAVNDLNELAKVVPNFSFDPAYGSVGTAQIAIRGISGNVRNAGFESGVSMYVDGIYTGRPAAQNIPLANIERVEVLRGPQGTFFGKNSIAGAVSITTKKPGNELVGEGNVSFGNYGHRNFNGFINGPIAEDKVFFGISFFSNKRDGYIKNYYLGERDIGTDDLSGADLRLITRPNDALEITLQAGFNKGSYLFAFPESLDGAGSVAGDTTVYAPGIRTTYVDGIPEEQRESKSASLSVEYDLGENTLTSITAFNKSYYAHREDNDNSPQDYLFVAGWREATDFATQELRFTSPTGGKFDYIVGAYLFWQDVKSEVPFLAGSDFPGGPGLTTVFSDVQTKSIAGFAHANYHLTDRITFTGGLRYTYEDKELQEYRAVTPSGPWAGIYNFTSPGDARTDTSWSPMASISFSPIESINLYGKVAKGFKAGGWNPDFFASANGTPPPISVIDFEPESATTYEVGFKSELLNRNFILNIAAFKTDYKDLQVQSRVLDPLSGNFVFQFNNAATSTIEGYEVETTIRPFKGLRLQGAVGYTDAVYDSFSGAALINGQLIDYDGNRLPYIPKWNASLLAGFDQPLSEALTMSFSVDVSYKGSTFNDAANDPSLLVDGRTLVGGRVGLVTDRYDIYLWGENLTNRDYLITKQRGSQLVGTWAMPRTYGMQLTYRF